MRMGRIGSLGATITAATGDQLLKDNVEPLYEGLQDLSRRIDGAGAFVYKAPLWAAFDELTNVVNILDSKLATLDAADVNDWLASVMAAKNRLAYLAASLEAYTGESDKSAIASTIFGLVAGGLTSFLVYRSKKAKKWAVLAGSSAAAVSGLGAWTFTRPKAP